MFQENGDNVFHSKVCDHLYHSECICDWLERRSNTECPCCREPLVAESDVWEAVKAARKVKQKQAKQNRKKDRGWPLSSKHHATESTRTTQRSEEDMIQEDEVENDEERGTGMQHRRQETMITLNIAEEGEQSSDDSIADGNAENGQNQSYDASAAVEVELEESERTLDAPSDEESSETRDP